MNGLAERHAVRPGESTPGGSELPAPRGEPADSLTGEPARHPDPDGLAAASRVVYRIRQRFRYTYDGPAADLVHRLVAVPPRRHGDQTCRRAHVAVSAPDARLTWQRGPDGLRVATVRIPVVPPVLDFDITVEVERVTAAGPPALPASALSSRRLLAPTRLTEPSPELVAAARSLACEDPVLTARRICSWVHQRIAYAAGSTDVTTTAAQALAGGRGVCQDQAHVMIAMCRAVGIPARYVLGHMLGEGASHAWVEVIVPPGRAEAAGTGAGAAGAAAAPGRAAAGDPWAMPAGRVRSRSRSTPAMTGWRTCAT